MLVSVTKAFDLNGIDIAGIAGIEGVDGVNRPCSPAFFIGMVVGVVL